MAFATWIKQRAPRPVLELISFARSEAMELVAVACVTGLALAFAAIADEMQEAPGRSFDLWVLQTLHPGPDLRDAIGPKWLEHAALDLTSLGSVAVLASIALIAVGYLLIERQMLKALALTISLAGGLVLSETMKLVFERTRPPDVYRASEVLNASFPSGHALLSTVAYLSLGAMLSRAMPHRALRFYVMAIAITLALLVGITRVYLGVHWTTDVLAGWCLGASWATACWLAERLIRRAMKKPDVPAT